VVKGSEKHIVVIGGGFAGLWAAMGAAKRLDEALDNPDVAITLVNRDDWHAIRVRNYETNISDARLPLGPLLEQAEVELVIHPKDRFRRRGYRGHLLRHTGSRSCSRCVGPVG
jgi:hypothetical protein